MSYYLAAYVIFWVVLFGYLLALLRRQVRLVARAESLVARLGARSSEIRPGESRLPEVGA